MTNNNVEIWSLDEIPYDFVNPNYSVVELDDEFIDEQCGIIDRRIEQTSHEQANHRAEMTAIREGYDYEVNTDYDPSAYVDQY